MFGPRLTLSMQPELRMELKSEQRLELEQRLEQRLEQQLEFKMTLQQYLEQEGLINSFITWANENDAWKDFNKEGFRFRYACLPYSLASPIADTYGPGFAHCHYNPFEGIAKGQWTLFLVPELIPHDLIDFIALHERGEEISLGNHYFASQLEFASARKRGRTKRYVRFIDEKYPSKFIDLTQKILFPILPDELLHYLSSQGRRNEAELERAEHLIDKYPISSIVLKRMDRYAETSKRVCERIIKEVGPTQSALYDLFVSGDFNPESAADVIDRHLSEMFKSFDPDEARVVSIAEANHYLAEFKKLVMIDVYRETRRHLDYPDDFHAAYRDSINGRRLVTPIRTAGDTQNQDELRAYALTL